MNTTDTTRDSTFVSDAEGSDASLWRNVRNSALHLLRRAERYGQSAMLLSLRLLYGAQFAQTGWGKLTHLARTAGFFESIGIPAPLVMATLVGATELIGGLMFAFGAGTRFAAAALTTVMVTALMTAHVDEAFSSLDAFTKQEPFPFLVASLLLLVFGAGWFSLDDWLRSRTRARTEAD